MTSTARTGMILGMRADDEQIDDDFFQAAVEVAAETMPLTARTLPPRLGLLADLSDSEFDQVARAAKLSFQPEGAIVFRQGDAADRFFILVDGGVEVERDGAPLATLGPGAFFGESALLVRGRRSATITTIADSSLWSIDYAAFDDAVSHHLLADSELRAEAERRIIETPEGRFEERDGR